MFLGCVGGRDSYESSIKKRNDGAKESVAATMTTEKEYMLSHMDRMTDIFYRKVIECRKEYPKWCAEVIKEDAETYNHPKGVFMTKDLAVKRAAIYEAMSKYAEALVKEKRVQDNIVRAMAMVAASQ